MVEEAVHLVLNSVHQQQDTETLLNEFAQGMWSFQDGEFVKSHQNKDKMNVHINHENREGQKRKKNDSNDTSTSGLVADAGHVYDEEERLRLSARAGGYDDSLIKQRALSELLNGIR